MAASRSMYPRPALEFRYALDACAAQAHTAQGPTLLISGHDLYVRELRRRLPAIRVDGADDHPPAIRTLILAEPDQHDLRRIAYLKPLLAADGRLLVIVPGTLARFLPARSPAAVGRAQVVKALRQHGFDLTGQTCFHGMTSIFWSYAFRFWRSVGRDDLADRSLRRMHQAFVTRRPYLTTLMLLTAVPSIGGSTP